MAQIIRVHALPKETSSTAGWGLGSKSPHAEGLNNSSTLGCNRIGIFILFCHLMREKEPVSEI
jgi:hypothetical protein